MNEFMQLTAPSYHQIILLLLPPPRHHHYQELRQFHLQMEADPFLDLTSVHLSAEGCWVHQDCLKIPVKKIGNVLINVKTLPRA